MLSQELKEYGFLEILARSSPWHTIHLPERARVLRELDTHPCLDAAYSVFKPYTENLQKQLRWKDFGVPEMGDMNVDEHTIIRQTPLTAHAISYDAQSLNLGQQEVDWMLSGAMLHDLGEATTGDIIYDIKATGNKRAFELVEAREVMKIIDKTNGVTNDLKRQLKEIYLRITTSLEEEDILSLLGKSGVLTKEVNLGKLRELFGIYERYGYLITSLQVFISIVFEEAASFTKEEIEMIRKWNRKELKDALSQGVNVPEKVRGIVLTKNVLLNQWQHIIEADKRGIPSVRGLFDTKLTKTIVTYSNELMGLNLDLSFFADKY